MNISRLLRSELINISALARLMYPNNKHSGTYLRAKIAGKYGRVLTYKDKERIKAIIQELIK